MAAGLAVPPAAESAVWVVLVVVLVGMVRRWEVVHLLPFKAMLAERAPATMAVAVVALVLQVLVAPLKLVGSGCSLTLLA